MSVLTQRPAPTTSSVAGGARGRIRSAGRTTAAVLGGLATIVLLSNGTDVLLEGTGVFPSVAEQQRDGFTTGWMLGLALVYRTAYVALGAGLTARIAGGRRGSALVALALVGVVLGSIGAAAQDVTPLWFSLALVLLGPVGVAVGGRLAHRPSSRS